MATTDAFAAGTTLVIIKHPEKGTADSGKAICDEIRRQLGSSSGPVCLLHEASGMATANSEYAAEFKKLDREIVGRLVEVVCAIPGSIPRMMAHTVAMFSDKVWNIFKSNTEAAAYLNARGFKLADVSGSHEEPVRLVVLK